MSRIIKRPDSLFPRRSRPRSIREVCQAHFGAYEARAREVYWNHSTPACRAKGPDHAVCLLEPGHEGRHYGNGYDTWGPKNPFEW